jgi:hypothetical protein
LRAGVWKCCLWCNRAAYYEAACPPCVAWRFCIIDRSLAGNLGNPKPANSCQERRYLFHISSIFTLLCTEFHQKWGVLEVLFVPRCSSKDEALKWIPFCPVAPLIEASSFLVNSVPSVGGSHYNPYHEGCRYGFVRSMKAYHRITLTYESLLHVEWIPTFLKIRPQTLEDRVRNTHFWYKSS